MESKYMILRKLFKLNTCSPLFTCLKLLFVLNISSSFLQLNIMSSLFFEEFFLFDLILQQCHVHVIQVKTKLYSG